MFRLSWVIVLLIATGAPAQGYPDWSSPPSEDFSAKLVSSHLQIAPGGQFHIAIDMAIAEGWVFYSPDPGEIAQPANIQPSGEKFEFELVRWPHDHTKETDLVDQIVVNNVYQGRAVAYVTVNVPQDVAEGEYLISVKVAGQICDSKTGLCIPVSPAPNIQVMVAAEAIANPAWNSDDAISGGLDSAMTAAELRAAHRVSQPVVSRAGRALDLAVWSGLGLAILAGLILNVMPCVLPVIPLRIISIVQMAGQSRRRFVTLGLAFAGGIVLFFAGLAGANILLRLLTNRAINWSEHFQLPSIRIALAMIIVALAGNLFGLFNVTVPQSVAAIEARDPSKRRGGHIGSAGMGLMMAVLATPCSFAILALAMAWAQLQPLWLGTVAILLIGVGMAAPHALLGAFPQLLDKLPKPGAWMEKLKQSMGFALLPVAIWLIGTLSVNGYVSWVMAYAVVLSFALWVWGSWVRYDAPFKKKLLVRGACAALAVGAGFWMLTPAAPLAVEFSAFDQSQLDNVSRGDKPVLVKFTAAWCLSCKWVDATIYNSPEIAAELAKYDLIIMKADVTNENSAASNYLAKQFGGAPPLTVVYPVGGRQPILLEGKFSKSELTDALESALGR